MRGIARCEPLECATASTHTHTELRQVPACAAHDNHAPSSSPTSLSDSRQQGRALGGKSTALSVCVLCSAMFFRGVFVLYKRMQKQRRQTKEHN